LDPLSVTDIYITNAVRCAPPGTRPAPEEARTCRSFLQREIVLLPRLRAVLALGRIAHETCVRLLDDAPLSARPFAHGAQHRLATRDLRLVDSYHPSRQNTNTGVLTWEMWREAAGVAWRLAARE